MVDGGEMLADHGKARYLCLCGGEETSTCPRERKAFTPSPTNGLEKTQSGTPTKLSQIPHRPQAPFVYLGSGCRCT